MSVELQLIKEDLEKERNNIRKYIYHPSLAGHSKREMTAVYEALGKIISRIDSMKEPIDNDLDEEIVNWCNHGDFGFDYMDIKDTVHHFANWQKQQLMNEIWHKGTDNPGNKHPYPVINPDTQEMAFAYYYYGWNFDRDYNPGCNMLWLDIEKILPDFGKEVSNEPQ